MISETNYFWSLIERAQQGNKNSFLELAKIFKDKIYLHALRLTGNITLAEKVTTKLFTKAWQHIKFLTPNSPFELWLNGLTVSIVVSYFRKKKDANEPFADEKTVKDSPPIICKDRADEIFLNLNIEQRLILFLHDYQGYTTEDCSVMFNEKHIDKLKSDLHTARLKFTDTWTIDLMNSLTDSEWGNFVQDFEQWQVEELSIENMTDTLRLLNNYRRILSNFLISNATPPNILDGLRNTLFEESDNKNKKVKKETDHGRKLDPLLLDELTKDHAKEEKDSLTDEIAELFSVPDPKERMREKRARLQKHKRIFIYTIILLFAGIDLYSLISNSFLNSTFPWTIESRTGKVLVNGDYHSGEVTDGDLISSGINVTGLLSIKSIGKIIIQPHTQLKILKGKSEDNRIELISGKIKLETNTYYHRLTIETDNYEFCDYGSRAEITVHGKDNGVIEVKRGGLRIKKGELILPVFEDYIYHLGDKAAYSSINSMISDETRQKLEQSSIDTGDLRKCIEGAGLKDCATLWTLLFYYDQQTSNTIFEKINNLVPLPKTETKSGILNKDFNMLNRWLDEIEAKM
ncbi:MAG: RNA polymerase sigma factor [bacterium]